MYRFLIFTLLFFFTLPVYASPRLIAVLDLVNKTRKFKVDEIFFLTDLIRKTAVLIEKNDISVITKDNILQLLPPDKTLEECINECAIKTGQLLGADWIVTGQVIEFGTSYRVSISLYTKAGILEDQQAISGSKIEDLEIALKEASIKLFTKIDPSLNKESNENDLSFQGTQIPLDIPKININQGQLNQINLEAEKLLEVALDIEDKKESTSSDKMQAWCKLSMVESSYKEQALVACQKWADYVRAYESNMLKIKDDFNALKGYLLLKRKTNAQKKSAIMSFLKTYQNLSSMPEYQTVSIYMNQIDQVENNIDIDQDGIVDQNDKCPEQKEDLDSFQDEDGCPDTDNDQDGVPDQTDKCPKELEDKDGYADDDGCLEPDNDQDGFMDANDKCPNQSEDKDGFMDEDGCPDPDNDQDSVLDANDKCPKELEDKDNYEDHDGCPEFGPIDITFFDQKMKSFYLSYTPTELNAGGKEVANTNILGLNFHVKKSWFEYSFTATVSTDLSFISILFAPYIPNEHYFGVNLISWPNRASFSLINLSFGLSLKTYFLANLKSKDKQNYCIGLLEEFDPGDTTDNSSCIAPKGLAIYPGFYIRNVVHLGCSYMASITLNNTPIHINAGKLNNGEDFYLTSLSFGFGWTFGSRCD
jgi:hypothetical protein